MSYDRFYEEMLDYCLALFCAFSPKEKNQAGMVVFKNDIKVVIPLRVYTRVEWHNEVERIRATKDTDELQCCFCCTPLAEAFDLAGEEFATSGLNQFQIAFVITDGVPSNNNVGSGGNPSWWYTNSKVGLSPAVYSAKIVPNRARILKRTGARIFLVGVPNVFGRPPSADFFSGKGEYARRGKKHVEYRENRKFAVTYKKGPNPIVSLPVSKNSFSMNTWDIGVLVNGTVGALCEATFMPTRSPTRNPSQLPTMSPTKAPTFAPTFRPSHKPTKSPTQTPSLKPTPAPTFKPSTLPTQSPSSSTPTFSPSTLAPTPYPTRADLTQVDVTFLVDRSDSMNDYSALCRGLIAAAPVTPGFNDVKSLSPCWEVLMRYILQQADLLTEIPAGKKLDRKLGWADDFPNTASPSAGLRINIIGFSCSWDQSKGLLFEYSRDFFPSGPISSRKQLVELLSHLVQTVRPTEGTCPALAIEKAVQYVEETSYEKTPFQSVILITDGLFYDGDLPARAAQGLTMYKVTKFAVGIALGLVTQKQKQIQVAQLTEFVGFNRNLFKNLGADGWALLPTVAKQISQDIALGMDGGEPALPRGWWCGYRSPGACASKNYRDGNCKWSGTDKQSFKCYHPSDYTLAPTL